MKDNINHEVLSKHRLYPKLENEEYLIRSLCYTAAQNLYGETLPDIVKKRLELELEGIINHGMVSPYLITHQVVKQLKLEGYLVSTRGSVGSTFIAYCLGITEMNPLFPHYRCNHCKYSEWIQESKGCGIDLPDKVCPNCSEIMQGDGHHIPCEMFMGLQYDITPNIDLCVATECSSKVYDYLSEHYGYDQVVRVGNQHRGGFFILPKGIKLEQITFAPFDDNMDGFGKSLSNYKELEKYVFKLDVFEHIDPTFLRLLGQLTGVEPTTIPMQDANVLSLFRSTQALGVSPEQLRTCVGTYGIPEMQVPFVRAMLEETQPKSYSDLLQISGLSHGNGTWEANAQDLLKSGEHSLQSVIACRDDVMFNLINWGVGHDMAFLVSDNVRKGLGISGEWVKELEVNVPSWFIESCQKMKYLFPKAHAVTYVISAIRYAYYKLYYPLEFYAVYFSVRGRDFNLELCTEGAEVIGNILDKRDEQPQPDTQYEVLLDLSDHQVALEMMLRGICVKRDTISGQYLFEYNHHKLKVPLVDV
ncbi:hypothetical protein [Paenibacillus sp. UNC451MF]|uniref:hypothetical protein n=1 Tax=Paenibacillus sp. UNC451MF TaxID=1449063 RepID=UPI000491687C|nr:hypothetical protein [Paenibacillus sp. UNC451MF]